MGDTCKASVFLSAKNIFRQVKSLVNLRYLTEITNQILALVSLDQAQALKFKESASYDLAGGKKGHIVSFKVAKAGYQCEDVTAHPRFEAHRAMSVMVTILICLLLCASRPSIRIAEPQSQCPVEYQPALESILAVGGTQQAFLAMESQRETCENSQTVQTMAETHLRSERRYAHMHMESFHPPPSVYFLPNKCIGRSLSVLEKNRMTMSLLYFPSFTWTRDSLWP